MNVYAASEADSPPIRVLGPASTLPETDLQPSTGNLQQYVLGPGDELLVTDPSLGGLDQPYTTVVPVLPDGTVTIYPVGVMVASGKSLQQLTEELRARASETVRNPAMVISLARMRPVEVYVLGNVINPGLYSVDVDRADRTRNQILSSLNTPTIPLPGRFTGGRLTGLASSPEPVKAYPTGTLTVLTALQMAGGARETADIRHILLRRPGLPQPIAIDLWQMVAEGDASQDVVLRTGDTIVVPRGGADFDAELLGAAVNRKRAVRVFGAVRNPGIYELGPRDDVLSIISRAGGFTDTAKKGHVILSRQYRDGHIQTTKVSVNKTLKEGHIVGRYPVQPGDVLEAKDSIILKTAPRAAVIASTFMSAFFILYFSRIIVDRSQPNTTTSSVVVPAPTTAATASTPASTQ